MAVNGYWYTGNSPVEAGTLYPYTAPGLWIANQMPDAGGTGYFAPGYRPQVYIPDSAQVTVGSWSFTGSYQFTVQAHASVTFAGAGLVFANAGNLVLSNYGSVYFTGSSTAGGGNAVIHNYDTSTSGGQPTGIFFEDSSKAGNAQIVVHPNARTTFADGSSADHATLTIQGEATLYALQGIVRFFDASTAASATINVAPNGIARFHDASTAGNATVTVRGSADDWILYANLEFFDASSAGNATVNIEAVGNVSFHDTSSAGAAGITNLNHLTFDGSSSAGTADIDNQFVLWAGAAGSVEFHDASTAANAHIMNGLNGDGSGAGGRPVTHLFFYDKSTTASATIDNKSAVEFHDTSKAGTAHITNYIRGTVDFYGSSSAGSAVIENGNPGSGGEGGGEFDTSIIFHDTSTAGMSQITNRYMEANSRNNLYFYDQSSAGKATIANHLFMRFYDSSTASEATIVNDIGDLYFYSTSTAGKASIANAAYLRFYNNSTADHARIDNKYMLVFANTTSAGHATIANQKSDHGRLAFQDLSTAGSAAIDNKAGANLTFSDYSTAGDAAIDNSSYVWFQAHSTGGNARLTNAAGAVAEFSETIGPNGDHKVSIGSLSGGGAFWLGANRLTVGSNNLNTTVTGILADGGSRSGDSGAALVKVGAGTLALAGDNTYTGGTTVNGGTLEVDGGIRNNAVVNSGGTLAGKGVVGGAVTVNAGGALAPGAGIGLIATGKLTLNPGARFAAEFAGTTPVTKYDVAQVAGTVTISNATLQLALVKGFSPSTTSRQNFVILDNDGTDAILGTFNGLAEGARFAAGGRLFTISYKGGTGNDVAVANEGVQRIGGSGNDKLKGTALHDELYGNAGNDTLVASGGGDRLDGGAGLDVADYSGRGKALKVTLDSKHTLKLMGDTLTGIEGLFGGSKADSIKGDGKANLLHGGGGSDTLSGGKGKDTIQGGSSKDTIDGGGGRDLADYSDKTKAVIVKLDGSNWVTVKVGGKAEDKIRNFENVTGGSKNDTLSGDGKANALDGGPGKDKLTGGADKDQFVFSTRLSPSNVDTITDFKHGTDNLVLDDAIFKAIGAKLDKGEFYSKAGATAAHDADDRIIYDSRSGKLYSDDDGKGDHAAIHFATLTGHPSLAFTDFTIV